MQYAIKHMNYAHIKCNKSNSWACSPYFCASLRPSFSLLSCIFAPSWLCPYYLTPLSSYIQRKFHIFVHLFPFVINNHKWYASFDTKGGSRSRRLILESSVFMDTTICWNDTTCNYHMWKHEDHLEMPHVGHLWDPWPWCHVVGFLPLCQGICHTT
jgi:hypothetical protein